MVLPQNRTAVSDSVPVFGGWTQAVARAASVARSAAPLGGVLVLALFLRLYTLRVHAWVPDTYEQMTAAIRLTRLEFPLSRLYPPGVAVTLAPVFLVLPASIASLQAVVVAASLALVAICFIGAARATGDRVVATLAAGGAATAPLFIYGARIGLFDAINAMWLTLAFMLVPAMRQRSFLALAAYGALLALAMNIRATNVAYLPALLIWWSGFGRPGVSHMRPCEAPSAARR